MPIAHAPRLTAATRLALQRLDAADAIATEILALHRALATVHAELAAVQQTGVAQEVGPWRSAPGCQVRKIVPCPACLGRQAAEPVGALAGAATLALLRTELLRARHALAAQIGADADA